MSSQKKIPVLILSGSVGAGKTTVSYAASHILNDLSIAHGVVDFDMLCEMYPRPANDPYNTEIGLKNLEDIWKNYEAEGATHLIISRVIEQRNELEKFELVIPSAEITLVLLKVSLETSQERLRKREMGKALEWHLDRSVELVTQLEQEKAEDFSVTTDNRLPAEIAKEILIKAKWIT